MRLVALHQTPFDDYSDWAKADKKLFERIRRIITETAKMWRWMLGQRLEFPKFDPPYVIDAE